MSTTAPELFTSLRTGWVDAVQQWMDTSQSIWDELAMSFTATGPDRTRTGRARGRTHHDHGHRREHGHHHHDHRHGPCDCRDGSRDDCRDACRDACDCCVPDADVVLHARVGERRVVPLHLHNAWRRERQVTLGVGPWHVCSGDGLTVIAVLEEEQLTLQACEDRVVRLVVGVSATKDDGGEPGVDEGSHEAPGQGRLSRDVDGCASAYADLRFEGCARPLRVAVVVSPADCDPVEVGCDCDCCC